MKISRSQLRRLIESTIYEAATGEGKFVNQDNVINILTMFFGYMEGLRNPNIIDDNSKNIRAFYKLAQDSQSTLDNDKIALLFDRLLNFDGHQLASGKAGSDQTTPNKYSLDRESYGVLVQMDKLNKKMGAKSFGLEPIYDFGQKKSLPFSYTYNDIKKQNKDYMKIPEMI
tara:strand:+ start:441 stop:953 length:513 start_codon:yes stop_codon:yes gene_type:complete